VRALRHHRLAVAAIKTEGGHTESSRRVIPASAVSGDSDERQKFEVTSRVAGKVYDRIARMG